MPRAKRMKKFGQMKKMISLNDPRLKAKDRVESIQAKKRRLEKEAQELKTTEAPQVK